MTAQELDVAKFAHLKNPTPDDLDRFNADEIHRHEEACDRHAAALGAMLAADAGQGRCV